ncbi:MAG: kelch repeat-containing protein [Bacteroidales bacterium]
MRNFTFLKQLCIKVVLMAVLSGIPLFSQAQEDTWTTKASMPNARGYLSTCVVDGKIYAIGGGFNASEASRDVEEYDPVTDSWTSKNNLPEPRVAHSTSQINGKIYIIGGASSILGTVYSSVYEYDPVTDSCTRKADMPTGRLTLSTSVANGKIYAIGGAKSNTNFQAEKIVEEYDPVTDTWTSKADMLTARAFVSTAVVQGKIYAIGGASTMLGPVIKTVEEYDPATDTWTQKADLVSARGWHTASVVNGNIYAIAGASDADTNPNRPSIESYNPTSDEWTIIDSIPTARRTLCSSVVDGIIFTLGGITGGWGNLSLASNKVEAYNPAADTGAVTNIVRPERSSSFLWIFPNPFSSSTTFQYNLAVNAHVRLCVYDIPGHEVNLLVNEKKPAGCCEIKWDGRDKCGQQVADGIYFCTLIINNKLVETKKLMLQN